MKLLATIIFLLIASTSVSAGGAENAIRYKVICKEGYKFLVTWVASGTWRTPSIVQIYREGSTPNQPPQPLKCK